MSNNKKQTPTPPLSLGEGPGVRPHKPWLWIPTLYFAEGLPYVAVMTLAVILYKRLGLSNTEIALYTSWLYLPWTIKPLWSPFVDLIKTKRWWITTMQALIAASMAGIAFFIPTDHYVQATLACFWLMAFGSATHDIAADGFYMLGLTTGEQSFFVGIRNTFYRLANIFGQGILVMLAGWLETSGGNIPLAWSLTFYFMAGLFIAITLYHRFVLPRPDTDVRRPELSAGKLLKDFVQTFVSFFRKKHIGLMFFFLLTYRLGESQLVKIASPFLLDSREAGGLGLDTASVGMIYGTLGVAALLVGGIVSGLLVSRHGFRRWLLPMALAINLPDLLYVWLAVATPDSAWVTALCVAVEQLGYGFGFTAYTLYLIYIAEGEHKTAHYAIGTGFMALGMMLPGMPAGWLQETMGYSTFFVWVCLCTVPGIVAALLVRKQIGPEFGKRQVS
ncbi:AmpG family muropeptide MFS transporter [Bacteroides sp.]|uniref:AmpG family muropeptide MFS transporter n=1 Tax=Bacteroides sp. TaxID=29523 RepID=UPI0025854D4B|nr:AmpG family muropeptide MFS transporter [Bacteroides sp.]